MDYKIILGIAPTRREGFPDPKFAVENKKKIQLRLVEIFEKIGDIQIVDIDWLNEEGILVNPMDVPKVADYFREKKIDALFMPHCNYGCEEVVAMLGKRLGKPVCVWGPRDDAPPEGFCNRNCDTQCGLFASTAALRRYHVPYYYIENCWLEEELLDKELDNFIRLASVVKEFGRMRVGQIGARPKPFLCVMVNESEMLEKFGIEVIPITAIDIIDKTKEYLEKKSEIVAAKVKEITSKSDCSYQEDEQMTNIAAFELAAYEIATALGCNSLAVECWQMFGHEFGIEPCSAIGDLIDMGMPTACETDIHGAVTMAALTAVTRGKEPVFLADWTVRHPTNDNAELLWHCGPFPRSLAKEECCPAIRRSHGQFEIKGGDITLGRFTGMDGEYQFFSDEVKSCEGPHTVGTYVWIETENWSKWEKRLMYGPYVHHVAGVHGKYARILHEAMRFLNIPNDSVNEFNI